MTAVLDTVLSEYRATYLAAQVNGACSPEVRKSLEANGNTCTNWSRFFIIHNFDDGIKDDINCINIHNCYFDPGADGMIIIVLKKSILNIDGILMSNRLQNSNFYGTCIIGPGSLIIDATTISNVFIGSNSAIIGCGTVCGPELGSVTTFGNYESVSVGSESGGGRSVLLDVDTSFYNICRQAYLGTSSNTSSFARIEFNLSVLSNHVKLLNCDKIQNCLISEYASVSRSSMIECTLKSTQSRPITIRTGAQMQFCLVNEGCVIEDSCYCDHVYMCESSSIGVHARVCDSILAADASIAGGECHRSLVGPFIGFHHHSLLIATLWPFGRGNLGYGAKVGANHSGRVNDQECWPGEGCFFGLGCSIKFPMNLYNSPYSIVAPDTALSPQCIQFPCSLICALTPVLAHTARELSGESLPVDACLIKPAWILYANPYMMDRAISKFSSRRKSKYFNTSFPVYRPSIINKMVQARTRILTLLRSPDIEILLKNGDDCKVTYVTEKQLQGLGRCIVSLYDLHKALESYTATIRRYALHGFLYRLLTISSTTDVHALLISLSSKPDIKSSKSIHLSIESSLEGMVDAITEDLEYYNPDTQSRTQHQVISSPCVSTTSTSTTASSTTAIITDIDSNNNMKHVRAVLLQDTHTEYINNHQLQLLRIEYSDLLTTHTETKMIVGTLLGDLVEIEKAYALEVRSSRQKDGERGMSIIPDYKRVNQVADDVGKDAVVAAALKRAQDILIFGQGVRIKLDL